jgi:uncharacterized RDD family membrane protein YckC
MTEVENNITYAGFWRRFAAFWIDHGIMTLFIAGCVTLHAMGSVIEGMDKNLDLIGLWKDAFDLDVVFAFLSMTNPPFAWITVALIATEVVYFTFFESSVWQATPGKRLMKIRVMDYEGQRLEFPQALGRNAFKVFSQILMCLGYLMILVTTRKQALHDRLAKTVMVRG